MKLKAVREEILYLFMQESQMLIKFGVKTETTGSLFQAEAIIPFMAAPVTTPSL